jgi:alkyl hydroperoxide reductase subunit AhpC
MLHQRPNSDHGLRDEQEVVTMRAQDARLSNVLPAAMLTFAVCAGLALSLARPAQAAPTVGQPAPEFSAATSEGKSVNLSDYRGSIVVLEWSNHDCPFVRRHYESGNMQRLQKQAKEDGVVWLTIISSAPGEQGFVSGGEADALTASRGASPTAVVLDPTGALGRAYQAKTTPHMFVISPTGTLAYMGAIDDQPRNFGADPARATNYVSAALAAISARKPVDTAVTQPYGCSVKYKNGA